MFFFKIVAASNMNIQSMERSSRSSAERAIIRKTAKFNEERPDSKLFLVESDDDEITIVALMKNTALTEELLSEFCTAAGIEYSDPEIEETTLTYFADMLQDGYRSNLTGVNPSEILSMFGLDKMLSDDLFDCFDIEEELMSSYICKSSLFETAEKTVPSGSLKKELERIYISAAAAGIKGHPVHYMTEADDAEPKKLIIDSLLKALYDNGRIASRKFCRVKIEPTGRFSRAKAESLYKSCTGGAVVLDFKFSADGGDKANAEYEIIGAICDVMKRYRHSVLTAFCLPRVCERVKKVFFENLPAVTVVELTEDLLGAGAARAYLQRIAAERGVAPDRQLYSQISRGGSYLPGEVRAMFDRWYDVKLTKSVYPQYKCKVREIKKEVKSNSRGNAYDELSRMIGLQNVKAMITGALDYYKLQRMYGEFGIVRDRPAMHMVFTGNPGTAKTTVARLFAAIMRENGVLSSGHIVEVGRSDLVGKYVGWTAKTVIEKFDLASGGVLFIDEAYSLVDEKKGSFGDEAITTIVREMENRRDDIIVIFAGYPDEMNDFLARNPGLNSRIAFHVDFPDYTPEELCGIAGLISASKGLKLSEGAVGRLSVLFEAAIKRSDFGNGCYARNIIEAAEMNLASRVAKMDPAAVTKEILTTLEAEDIKLPAPETAEKKILRIGFSA